MILIPTIEYHESISSTNDRVKELLKQAEAVKLPCLVVTKRQTAGRGRNGKAWWSANGSLLMSLGVDLKTQGLKRDDLSRLSLSVGETVLEMLRDRFGFAERITIHPPNDVYIDGKKIAGILIESPLPRYAVIGVGINVNNRMSDIPPQWQTVLEQRQITSLIEYTGTVTDIPPLIVDFLLRLDYKVGDYFISVLPHPFSFLISENCNDTQNHPS